MRILTRMLVTGLLLCTAAVAVADDSPAAQVVRKLDDALLQVLRDSGKLDFKARVEKLTPAVDAAYDVPFMAEKSLGAHWKDLNEADQKRWIDLSRRFSIANYAANFNHWGNQTIDLLGEEPSPNDTVVVHTRINDPQGENVDMSYRLRSTDGGWKIVDVYLKGTVSELTLRRSDYTAVFEKQGFEGLVKTMEGRLADLAAGKAKR